MLGFLFVMLLGHEEYSVREAATAICKAPQFECYLRHALVTSDCPEIRQRARSIIGPLDRKRHRELYENDPYTYYRQWYANNCESYYIDEATIIQDIQNSDVRQKIIYSLTKDDPGSWVRKPYCYGDHITLEAYRMKARK